MTDLVILLLAAAIVGAAGLYVYKAKKNGQHCIGCPDAKQCAEKRAMEQTHSQYSCTGCCAGCSGCTSQQEETTNNEK